MPWSLASSRRENSASQSAIDEPMTICGPAQNCPNTATLSSQQRPMGGFRNLSPDCAIAGIVDPVTQAAAIICRRRPGIECERFCAIHVGIAAAEPEQPGRAAGAGAARDPPVAIARAQPRKAGSCVFAAEAIQSSAGLVRAAVWDRC